MITWQLLWLFVLVSAAFMGLALIVIYSRRRSPQERERRRRLLVNQTGRLGDAIITDVEDQALYYSYTVRGVTYTAAQDVSQIRSLLPGELEPLIGPTYLKYVSNNPADSILICEEWSGLRISSRAVALTRTDSSPQVM